MFWPIRKKTSIGFFKRKSASKNFLGGAAKRGV
jgi:hypothetical protein